MKSITVAELRQNPTQALDEVSAGETYVVTRHRHPIAKLVPVEDASVQIIPAPKNGGARLSERTDLPRRSAAEVDALLAELQEDR